MRSSSNAFFLYSSSNMSHAAAGATAVAAAAVRGASTADGANNNSTAPVMVVNHQLLSISQTSLLQKQQMFCLLSSVTGAIPCNNTRSSGTKSGTRGASSAGLTTCREPGNSNLRGFKLRAAAAFPENTSVLSSFRNRGLPDYRTGSRKWYFDHSWRLTNAQWCSSSSLRSTNGDRVPSPEKNCCAATTFDRSGSTSRKIQASCDFKQRCFLCDSTRWLLNLSLQHNTSNTWRLCRGGEYMCGRGHFYCANNWDRDDEKIDSSSRLPLWVSRVFYRNAARKKSHKVYTNAVTPHCQHTAHWQGRAENVSTRRKKQHHQRDGRFEAVLRRDVSGDCLSKKKKSPASAERPAHHPSYEYRMTKQPRHSRGCAETYLVRDNTADLSVADDAIMGPHRDHFCSLQYPPTLSLDSNKSVASNISSKRRAVLCFMNRELVGAFRERPRMTTLLMSDGAEMPAAEAHKSFTKPSLRPAARHYPVPLIASRSYWAPRPPNAKCAGLFPKPGETGVAANVAATSAAGAAAGGAAVVATRGGGITEKEDALRPPTEDEAVDLQVEVNAAVEGLRRLQQQKQQQHEEMKQTSVSSTPFHTDASGGISLRVPRDSHPLQYKLTDEDFVSLKKRWLTLLERLRPLGHISTGNRVKLYDNGDKAFTDMLAEIERAQQDVLLETYIFDASVLACRVKDALCEASQRGCFVVLIIDWVGSINMPFAWRKELLASGVRLVIFNPRLFLPVLSPSSAWPPNEPTEGVQYPFLRRLISSVSRVSGYFSASTRSPVPTVQPRTPVSATSFGRPTISNGDSTATPTGTVISENGYNKSLSRQTPPGGIGCSDGSRPATKNGVSYLCLSEERPTNIVTNDSQGDISSQGDADCQTQKGGFRLPVKPTTVPTATIATEKIVSAQAPLRLPLGARTQVVDENKTAESIFHETHVLEGRRWGPSAKETKSDGFSRVALSADSQHDTWRAAPCMLSAAHQSSAPPNDTDTYQRKTEKVTDGTAVVKVYARGDDPKRLLWVNKTGPVPFRDHRKILIVDGKVAFIGSLNISENGVGKKFGGRDFFYDLHARVKGPVVNRLQQLVLETVEISHAFDLATQLRSHLAPTSTGLREQGALQQITRKPVEPNAQQHAGSSQHGAERRETSKQTAITSRERPLQQQEEQQRFWRLLGERLRIRMLSGHSSSRSDDLMSHIANAVTKKVSDDGEETDVDDAENVLIQNRESTWPAVVTLEARQQVYLVSSRNDTRGKRAFPARSSDDRMGPYSPTRPAWSRWTSDSESTRPATVTLKVDQRFYLISSSDDRVLKSNVLRNERSIQAALQAAISNASNSVCLTSSYFIPPGFLRRALHTALSRGGVDVSLLLSGNSDVWGDVYATIYVVRKFLTKTSRRHSLFSAGWEKNAFTQDNAVANVLLDADFSSGFAQQSSTSAAAGTEAPAREPPCNGENQALSNNFSKTLWERLSPSEISAVTHPQNGEEAATNGAHTSGEAQSMAVGMPGGADKSGSSTSIYEAAARKVPAADLAAAEEGRASESAARARGHKGFSHSKKGQQRESHGEIKGRAGVYFLLEHHCHAKNIVVDHLWSSLGSFNFDRNLEVLVVFFDPRIAYKLESLHWKRINEEAEEMTVEKWNRQPFIKKLLCSCCYYLTRFAGKNFFDGLSDQRSRAMLKRLLIASYLDDMPSADISLGMAWGFS